MESLLYLLADGQFYSGQDLADQLGLSRTAIWKKIKKMTELGFDIESVTGKGYRLTQPLDLLNLEIIKKLLPSCMIDAFPIDFHMQLNSTNDHILRALKTNPMHSGTVVITERQSCGRGRLGKQWHSPFAAHIYLSMYWQFTHDIGFLSGLSLVIGIAVVKALNELGLLSLHLKWPNDVMCQGKKLAGILVETQREGEGPIHTVIGIGLNIYQYGLPDLTDNQATALDMHLKSHTITRNHVAAKIIQHLLQILKEYEIKGFGEFMSQWNLLDDYKGQTVCVSKNEQKIYEGKNLGVDSQGALQVKTIDGIKKVSSSLFSIRKI